MNHIKYTFVVCVTLVSFSPLLASNLSGRVTDSDSASLAGATLWWADTTVGTATDEKGDFSLHRIKGNNRLVASYVGFQSDTIVVDSAIDKLDVVMRRNSELASVVVTGRLKGNFIKQESVGKDEIISFAGLCKMACCNLAESFENSASVTVGFSDAISGARQIQMLGLAGTYTQILDENRAIMRGISAPYGLSYTPGMWLNSIQVSKGISSVTTGHEAITGQINLEHRKPTDVERLFLNLYINSELRPEMNISTAQSVGKSGKLSTVVLAHLSVDTNGVPSAVDHNGDGFRDMPQTQQYNIANRWSYLASSGVQLRWGVKLLEERRLGGDVDYTPSLRSTMYENNIYGSQIHNRGANGYFKVGAPIGSSVYDYSSGDELRSNIAMVTDINIFNEQAYFGLNDYDGEEITASYNLMYNHYFSSSSSLIMGVSGEMQCVDEFLLNDTPWLDNSRYYDLSRDENEVGVYVEYTYKLGDKFSAIAGLRGDYNSYYRSYKATPRGELKWMVTPSTTLRASVGLGHRSANIITDNIGMLATGREIIFDDGVEQSFNRQEEALTLGGSITQSISLLAKGDATLSVDYFRTSFSNSIIVDQEWNATQIHIYSTTEPSTTDTYQVDFSWGATKRLDIFATFRYTDSSVTLNRPDGTLYETERALVSRYKTLLNLQYATNMRRWTFDVTAQLNGPTRLPVQDGIIENAQYSPSYPIFFAQMSRRIGAWEIYAGCENIADYMQPNPIISADDPFSSAFNSSLVWGPLMGRKYYLGFRLNLY